MNKKLIYKLLLIIAVTIYSSNDLLAQGPPPPGGGGGGGGGPVGVPLDSDFIYFILVAGIVYFFYRYKKEVNSKKKNSKQLA